MKRLLRVTGYGLRVKRAGLGAPVLVALASLIVVAFAGAPVQAAEIVWKPTNQATIAWDAVSTFDDGTALPVGSTVQYDTFTRRDTDPVTTYVRAITVTAPTATLTFLAEGRYFVGVQAIRLINDTITPESNSTISWSDNTAVAQGGAPFGVSYYKKLKDPGGMR
jgi:hypothetical protein